MKGVGFSATRRSKKQWYCQVWVLGSRVQEWYETEAEAIARRQEIDGIKADGNAASLKETAPRMSDDLDVLFELFKAANDKHGIRRMRGDEEHFQKLMDKTIEHYDCSIKLLKKECGLADADDKVKARHITSQIVSTVKIRMLERDPMTRKPKLAIPTMSSYLVSLRAFFTWVILEYGEKLGIEKNPVPSSLIDRSKVKKLANTADTSLRKQEVPLLLASAKKRNFDLYLFSVLCFYGGMRPNEAVNAQWPWILWDTDEIDIPNIDEEGTFQAKVYSGGRIPLLKNLRDILEPLKKEHGYIVAPDKSHYHEVDYKRIGADEPTKRAGELKVSGRWAYQSELERAIIDAKLRIDPRTGKHDPLKKRICAKMFRHTYATLLSAQGVPIRDIQKFMRHTSVTTTERYANAGGTANRNLTMAV